MNTLPPDTGRKLTSILGRLGSDFAGERAAAGLLATRLLRDQGLSWSDVVVQPQTAPPSCSGLRELVAECLARSDLLTPWEWNFLCDLPKRRRLSTRQRAVLDQILGRARASRAAR